MALALMVGLPLLALNSFFYWLLVVKSPRSEAIMWLVGGALISLPLMLLVVFTSPPRQWPAALFFPLLGFALVGGRQATWLYVEHLEDMQAAARQEDRSRLQNPKVFEE